jgi:hypothetical protein
MKGSVMVSWPSFAATCPRSSPAITSHRCIRTAWFRRPARWASRRRRRILAGVVTAGRTRERTIFLLAARRAQSAAGRRLFHVFRDIRVRGLERGDSRAAVSIRVITITVRSAGDSPAHRLDDSGRVEGHPVFCGPTDSSLTSPGQVSPSSCAGRSCGG